MKTCLHSLAYTVRSLPHLLRLGYPLADYYCFSHPLCLLLILLIWSTPLDDDIDILKFYVNRVSGASASRERPEDSRLVKDLEAEREAKRVNTVVVWSIDRLGRSMINTLN
ncbi:MAG: recombinase family protein [Ignisphaera sp.]